MILTGSRKNNWNSSDLPPRLAGRRRSGLFGLHSHGGRKPSAVGTWVLSDFKGFSLVAIRLEEAGESMSRPQRFLVNIPSSRG